MKAALGFVTLALFLHATVAYASSEALLYSHCPKESGEYYGTFRGEILLHRAFLDPSRSEDENIVEGITHQLKYLWGHFRNDAAAHQALQVVLSAEPPTVRILEKKYGPYGRKLSLDYRETEERLRISDSYIKSAVEQGAIAASDSAVRVSYEVRFALAVCGRAQDPPSKLRVPLPPDPWLSYWHTPRARHRPLRYFKTTAVTNPCADDDFADLPHPFYYWYDWLPDRHGPDAAGHEFDCREWLKEDIDYTYREVVLSRRQPVTRDLARLGRALEEVAGNGPLSATLLVGVLDHDVLALDLDKWRDRIGEGKRGELLRRVRTAEASWQKSGPKERGTGMFLRTLDGLRQVMDVVSHRASLEKEFLRVDVEGKLLQSQRPIRIRAFLGMTDLFGPRPPQHWALLRRALAEDHLVFYWGHSGLGENFRLQQIEKNLGLDHTAFTSELAQGKARLVAFISCYSYMYFGQDLLAASAKRAVDTALVFTGMGPVREDHGAIPLFALIDRAIAKKPKSNAGKLDRLPFLADDEFWIIKQVTAE